jgi:hypothetical protein
MDIDEARRLDLIDQQHELIDRLFMLAKGLTNYVVVSARERAQVMQNLDELKPWSEVDAGEFEHLRIELGRITRLVTNVDHQLFSAAAQ